MYKPTSSYHGFTYLVITSVIESSVALVGPQTDGAVSQDKYVHEGDVANIMCGLKEGDLPVSFEWIKDGIHAGSLSGIKVVNHEFSSTLTILATTTTHAGNYYCKASNPVSWAVMKARVFCKWYCKYPSSVQIIQGHSFCRAQQILHGDYL